MFICEPRCWRFERNKNVSSPSTRRKPSWTRRSVLGLRTPGFEFRILCLEGSVIALISPSSCGSPGPMWPVVHKSGLKPDFIWEPSYKSWSSALFSNHPGRDQLPQVGSQMNIITSKHTLSYNFVNVSSHTYISVAWKETASNLFPVKITYYTFHV